MPSQESKIQHRFSARLQQGKLVRWASVYLTRGLVLGAVAASGLQIPVAAAPNSPPLTAPDSDEASPADPIPSAATLPRIVPFQTIRLANFGEAVPSPDSQMLADWVVHSSDNGKLPFVIIDKVRAQVFVFNAEGQLRGASAALLGLAVGDDTVPGIGQRKLSSIRPAERTTPAGRFVASLDRDIHGEEVLWVDYEAAVSLHRVVTGQPKERRSERLASPSPLDNRISYGCINVPVKFYENVVSPSFAGTKGIVYILPETRSAREVFGLYDVQDSSRRQASDRIVPVADLTAR